MNVDRISYLIGGAIAGALIAVWVCVIVAAVYGLWMMLVGVLPVNWSVLWWAIGAGAFTGLAIAIRDNRWRLPRGR